MKAPYRTPVDALAEAIMAGFVSSAGREPGVIISRLRPETRELLKQLTSDQAKSMRPVGLGLSK